MANWVAVNVNGTPTRTIWPGDDGRTVVVIDQTRLPHTFETLDLNTLEDAAVILHKHRIEKLLVVNDAGELRGLITVKDIQKKLDYPHACKDETGRLRVAAAVGVGAETMLRVELLIEAGVDLLVVDTAHGHSRNVLDTVTTLKKKYPEAPKKKKAPTPGNRYDNRPGQRQGGQRSGKGGKPNHGRPRGGNDNRKGGKGKKGQYQK